MLGILGCIVCIYLINFLSSKYAELLQLMNSTSILLSFFLLTYFAVAMLDAEESTEASPWLWSVVEDNKSQDDKYNNDNNNNNNNDNNNNNINNNHNTVKEDKEPKKVETVIELQLDKRRRGSSGQTRGSRPRTSPTGRRGKGKRRPVAGNLVLSNRAQRAQMRIWRQKQQKNKKTKGRNQKRYG